MTDEHAMQASIATLISALPGDSISRHADVVVLAARAGGLTLEDIRAAVARISAELTAD